MKDISKVILGAILILFLSSVASVSAEEQDIYGDGQGEVLLFSNVESSYTVRLPKVVDITANEVSFEIDAKGDIAGDEVLTITVPDGMEIKKGKYTDIVVDPDDPVVKPEDPNDKPDRPQKPHRPSYEDKPKTDKECAEEYGDGWVFSEKANACVWKGWIIPPTYTR